MTDARVALLKQVDFLAPLDDETLAEVIAGADSVRYAAGDRIVNELDSGADVFVITEGEAEVVVEPRGAPRRLLATLPAGSAFGEMASLTGELRSATVVAKTPVEALVIRDAEFDALRERRPEIALALLRMLGKRLADVDKAIDGLLVQQPDAPAPAADRERGTIRRVWRELVVNRKRDLAFLTLAAFVLTLVAIRLTVYVSFRLELAPRAVLRAAYVSGFALLFLSAASALLTFRPGVRKLVALAYGIGAALIFNELGVTLAFDIFFKDIHTADPDLAFDVERLYRRTEPLRAIAIGLVVLIQLVYLRGFYRRVGFIVATRLRALVRRR
jgi:CRP-like cAMP-binding protein